jgi:hypothetical protein
MFKGNVSRFVSYDSLLRVIRCWSSSKYTTYLQYLQTEGLPFPRSNNRSMSKALLLFTTGLMMGATRVVSSPEVGTTGAFAGAGGASSSSEESETSMFMVSSSTVVAGWALDRERGAMFRMCIEDVAKFLLIYNSNY